MDEKARRAEEARAKILASGDQELINRLYLMEAAQGQPAAQSRPGDGGPSLLGLGLAVGGGAWLGTVLAGMTLSGEMQQAFAAVAEDLGLDGGADLAAGNLTEASAGSDGLLDDLGLGDLGSFLDI